MDNSTDIQVINFAKSHMPDCKVNSTHLKSIKVESEYGSKWEVTFNKKVIPTVMPGVFNYLWDFHSIKVLTSGLKIVKP